MTKNDIIPLGMTGLKRAKTILLIGLIAFPILPEGSAAEPPSGSRVRNSINRDWRFIKGDPPGYRENLSYDDRPSTDEHVDDKAADTEPTEAAETEDNRESVLKPWILPTANPFIRDPDRRHVRPSGNPGSDAPYVQPDFDDSAWQSIDLPHDWAIEGPFLEKGPYGGMGRLPSWGIGWYRKKLALSEADRNKSIFLDVDGAMSYATVWLNGHLVGGWPFGYASWRVDLTPCVDFGGENQLAIRLDNPPASSRWYPGGGIYRNVWLTQVERVHVGHWGTFITTEDVSSDSATVRMQVVVDNDTDESVGVAIKTRIFELTPEGVRNANNVISIDYPDTTIPAKDSATVSTTAKIADPNLWGPPPNQTPHLYVVVTTVFRENQLVDTYTTRFGIREVIYNPDSGIIVNGERVRLQGVNQHHDLGALGAAFNTRAAERQLEMLREMGCNAIRMAHNPPAPELLDLTDRMGFLVMDESFDVWERKKTPLDFHLIFPDWHEPDLRALIRRDRNHPSVIMWSTGNEVGEQYMDQDGAAVAARLREIVREEDPTRPVTNSMNFAKPDMPFPAETDVISLNYQGEGIRQEPEFEGTDRIRTPPQYPAFRSRFPEKIILSSETACAFSSRGVYMFPVSSKISAPVRDGRGGDSTIGHVSAYELHAVDFGSTADKVFRSLDQHPFVAGEFVWTGWDHLGEPTPYYSSRSSYCGIIDLAGFKKDRFYLYQSRWRSDHPMAHILPHWTWPERDGEDTPVHVFTSGDEAELFLNGRSLGRKEKGELEYRLRWDDVVYEPGTLRAVAYRSGREWAVDEMHTAEAPVRLEVQSDRPVIRADGSDLAFVTVRVVDRNGVVDPRSSHLIHFDIEGPGELVATDNGDPTNFQPFSVLERDAFSGLCLAIVRSKSGEPGRVRVTASSAGLKGGVAVFTTTSDDR